MKILVIDDEKSLRYTIARILQKGGYEVLMAGEGEHGLDLFRAEIPDLVICDLNMPHVGGIDAISQIRREAPTAKIIAISGGTQILNADGLAKALENGADDVMIKPFRADDLLRRVADTLTGLSNA